MDAIIHREEATKLKIEPRGVTLKVKSTPSNKLKRVISNISLD
jgi:hypothetical protein